jgi:hypothetical protein
VFFFRRDLWFAIRAKQFNDKIKAYIAERPLHLPIRKKIEKRGSAVRTTAVKITDWSL